MEDVEMEVDEGEPDAPLQQKGSDEVDTTVSLPPPTPLVPSLSGPASGANVQIRKDYDPKGIDSVCVCIVCMWLCASM